MIYLAAFLAALSLALGVILFNMARQSSRWRQASSDARRFRDAYRNARKEPEPMTMREIQDAEFRAPIDSAKVEELTKRLLDTGAAESALQIVDSRAPEGRGMTPGSVSTEDAMSYLKDVKEMGPMQAREKWMNGDWGFSFAACLPETVGEMLKPSGPRKPDGRMPRHREPPTHELEGGADGRVPEPGADPVAETFKDVRDGLK